MTSADESAATKAAKLVDAAQIAIRRADYEQAVQLLEESALLVPRNPEIAQLLIQTQSAARRHQSALERNRMCLEVAERVKELLDTSKTTRSRRMLQQAIIDYGQHPSFESLDQQISKREHTEQLKRAAKLAERSRDLFDDHAWREALAEAERALELDPHNRSAAEVRRQAREKRHSEESARHRQLAAGEAADEVERMIDAQELDEATVKLERAVLLHGHDHHRFDHLAHRLDHAASETRAEQRIEWAQRRSNEAADLVVQAARSSLSGDFELALHKLEEAANLDPTTADLDVKLSSARSALEKQRSSRWRGQELQRRKGVIRSLVRRLHLEEADLRLREAIKDFGNLPEFAALAARIEHLLEADRQPRGSLSNFDLQTLSSAYTWTQVALFPFRRSQVALTGLVAAITMVANVLSHPIAILFASALVLVPFGSILHTTAVGKSSLPSIAELLANRSTWRRWVTVAIAAGISCAPPFLFTVSSRWHDLMAVDSGILGWVLFALLLWSTAATFVIGAASSAIRAPLRALESTAVETLIATNCSFAVLVLVVLCHALPHTLARIALTTPVVAYAALVVPHLIGVLLRRSAPLWTARD